MPNIECDCTECKWNERWHCIRTSVKVSNNDMTAAGFVPLCKDYEEEDDEGHN